MAKHKNGKAVVNGSTNLAKGTPRSLPIAQKGVRTGHDFATLMSSLMSDLIEGKVTPSIGNATCNAGGKLLKVVEMQYKYGTQGPGAGTKTLLLTVSEENSIEP
jgi:hypothetical protein